MGNRWETVETVSDFILGGSEITADSDYSHEIKRRLLLGRTSLVAQMVKRLSTMLETWVQSLGWEDPLEKEMAIHSKTCLENPMETTEQIHFETLNGKNISFSIVHLNKDS